MIKELITKQKQVADLVLNKLFQICPYAIVAGGAPRDWYIGIPAQDIDVYFSTEAMTETMLLCQLRSAFGDTLQVKFTRKDKGHLDPIYQTLEGLIRIIDVDIDGVKVQLIQMDSSKRLFKVVDNFSISICKVWYKNGKINPTKDFLMTIKSGMMFLSEKYKWSDPHPAKMEERFQGKFSAGNREQVINKILNDSLKEK